MSVNVPRQAKFLDDGMPSEQQFVVDLSDKKERREFTTKGRSDGNEYDAARLESNLQYN